MGTPDSGGLGCGENSCEGIVAIGVRAFNTGDFGDSAGRTSALKKNQNIDGFCNETTRYSEP
jgi:hypothetical protein